MKKKYEITGVIDYAHCFTFEIEAENLKEAKKIADEEAKRYVDPAMAEMQTILVDKPKLN